MKREVVLVVDDIEMNRLILEDMLSETYDVRQASSGFEAVSMMLSAQVVPSIVLLDVMMPEMDGYEVLEIIKSNPLTEHIPVIFITAADAESNESRGLSLGAVDYISKPFSPKIVLLRVSNQLKLKQYSESLEQMVKSKVDELVHTKDKMLETMANIIEYRNLESGHHVKRTRDLCQILVDYIYLHPTEHCRVAAEDYEVILKSVLLHDVGKIGVPDNILLKPGPYTPEERKIMETHSAIGSEIIKSMLDTDDTKYLSFCYDIARYHHERWDGKGYPDGLAGNQIPLAACILAVVDVYDALVSARVYKPPITHAQAIDIIKKGSGTQFNPCVIHALAQVEREFERYNQTAIY